ncbi:MAG TPA: O-antigen ligase family protein [Gaiellaceae bacterium]|nr:O-antigen ligase family protein [Gaiellaceae bacterium]
MTAAAITPARVRAVPRTQERIVTGLFFASLFVATFEKVHWSFAGQIGINDIATILFLIAYVASERRPLPRTSAVVLAFFAAFALVYLAGFWNIETKQGLTQFAKGMTKFVIHWAFVVAAIGYLAQRGERFFWRALGWFTVGFVANAVYGILELGAALAGRNLDNLVLVPLTGGASRISVFGIIGGQNIYRVNALTGDPNHFGVMLIVPLLALTPVYLRLPRRHRLRWPLAAVLAFLLLVDIATFSRSGGVGLIAGILVLVLPYRRFFRSRQFLVPLGALVVVLLGVLYTRKHFFETFLSQRLSTSGKSTSAHFAVYDFIGQILHMHPLLGLGNNNFSVYYEFVTGKSNFGAHSYWVAVIVESGLLGLVLWIVFLRYVFVRLDAARRLGRLLDRLGDPTGAQVRPLAYGLTAALVGTIAANFFYLTMQFYYFYAFLAFALALPVVFGGRARGQPSG